MASKASGADQHYKIVIDPTDTEMPCGRIVADIPLPKLNRGDRLRAKIEHLRVRALIRWSELRNGGRRG